jgi:hypothetical protein
MYELNAFSEDEIANFNTAVEKNTANFHLEIDFNKPALSNQHKFADIISALNKRLKNKLMSCPSISLLAFQAGLPIEKAFMIENLAKDFLLPFEFMNAKQPINRIISCSFRFFIKDLVALHKISEAYQTLSFEKEAQIELLADYAQELGCWDKEKRFHNEHSRVLFFQQNEAAPQKHRDLFGSTAVFFIGGSQEMQLKHQSTHFRNYPVLNFWHFLTNNDKRNIDKKAAASLLLDMKNMAENGTPFILSAPFMDKNERKYFVEKCISLKMKAHFVVFLPKDDFSFFTDSQMTEEIFFTYFDMPHIGECHRFETH